MGIKVTDLLNGLETIYTDASDFLYDNLNDEELELFLSTFELKQSQKAIYENYFIERLQSELIY